MSEIQRLQKDHRFADRPPLPIFQNPTHPLLIQCHQFAPSGNKFAWFECVLALKGAPHCPGGGYDVGSFFVVVPPIVFLQRAGQQLSMHVQMITSKLQAAGEC